MSFLDRFRGRGRERVEPHFAMEAAGDAVVHGPASEAKRGDRLFWPLRFLTGNGLSPLERAFQWSIMLNILFAIIHIQSLVGWNLLLPLKRDVPYLYEERSYDRAVVNIKPLQMQGQCFSVVMEREAVRYVKTRHEVVADLDEMARRWGPKCMEKLDPIGYEDGDLLCSYIAVHTDPDEYRRFLEQEVKPVKQFIDDGYSRDVKILQDPIRRGETEDGSVVYEVRFVLRDFRKRQHRDGPSLPGERELVRERPMSSLITFRRGAVQMEVRHRHLNPFGLVASKYVPNEFQDFSEKKERR